MLLDSDLIKFLVINMFLMEQIIRVTAKNIPTANVEGEFSWLKQLQTFRYTIEDCEKVPLNSMSLSWKCFKLASLQLMKDMNSKAIIPLWPGVHLIKKATQSFSAPANLDSDTKYNYNKDRYENITWLESVFSSHVLELNLHIILQHLRQEFIQERANELDASFSGVSSRHRRHRYNMVITMFFGLTAFGAIIVPLGFQLLSLVSGKALLLAKMALLLASINALKRVTNSGVHYGLYRSPGEHYGSFYDRDDLNHT